MDISINYEPTELSTKQPGKVASTSLLEADQALCSKETSTKSWAHFTAICEESAVYGVSSW